MYRRKIEGLTLIELIIVIGILGILLAILGLNLRPFYNPLDDATHRVAGYLKQVRAKAMASTSAYRIRYLPDQHALIAERAKHCADTDWAQDPQLTLTLPPTVNLNMSDTPCFSSRGYALRPVTFTLTDEKRRQRRLALYIGGAVKKL